MKGWLLKNGTMYLIFDIRFVKNEHILSLKCPLGKSKLTGLILLGRVEINGFNFYWTKAFLDRYGTFSAAFG